MALPSVTRRVVGNPVRGSAAALKGALMRSCRGECLRQAACTR